MLLSLLVSACALVLAYAVIHVLFLYDTLEILCLPTRYSELLIKLTPRLSTDKKYRYPMFFGWHSFLQIVYSWIFRVGIPQDYLRQECPDPKSSDPVSLDWANGSILQDKPKTHPTVIIIPGIAGSAEGNYIQNFVHFIKNDFRVVIYNRPGCGNVKLSTHKFYLSAHSSTMKSIVDHVNEQLDGESPLIAVGFSMGAQNLLRYLAEYKDTPIISSVIVNPTFQSEKTFDTLQQKPLYDRALTTYLQSILTTHRHVFDRVPTVFEPHGFERVLKMKSFAEFNDLFISPVHGFKNVYRDYYPETSVYEDHLSKISIPTVLIQSYDDPITQPSTNYKYVFEAAKKNPNIILVNTQHGSHCAYEEMDMNWLILPSKMCFMEKTCHQILKSMVTLHNEHPTSPLAGEETPSTPQAH
jgi:predicted alpha/beta-fold hydrolase